jgi:hypothetical protein
MLFDQAVTCWSVTMMPSAANFLGRGADLGDIAHGRSKRLAVLPYLFVCSHLHGRQLGI